MNEKFIKLCNFYTLKLVEIQMILFNDIMYFLWFLNIEIRRFNFFRLKFHIRSNYKHFNKFHIIND